MPRRNRNAGGWQTERIRKDSSKRKRPGPLANVFLHGRKRHRPRGVS